MSVIDRALARVMANVLSVRGLRPIGGVIHRKRLATQTRATSIATKFFRNTPQLDMVGEVVKGECDRSENPVRVAVLACSTGAEVYSLATVLGEKGVLDRVELTALDISREALAQAEKGTYAWTDAAVSGVSREQLARAGECVEKGFQVRAELTGRIRWVHGDLLRLDGPGGIDGQDVVLCNNVLIHMGPDMAAAALRQVAGCVRPGGWLVVGGVDLAVRHWLVASGGFEPLAANVEAIHNGDGLLRKGWPFDYWGLEPMGDEAERPAGWYATIYRKK